MPTLVRVVPLRSGAAIGQHTATHKSTSTGTKTAAAKSEDNNDVTLKKQNVATNDLAAKLERIQPAQQLLQMRAVAIQRQQKDQPQDQPLPGAVGGSNRNSVGDGGSNRRQVPARDNPEFYASMVNSDGTEHGRMSNMGASSSSGSGGLNSSRSSSSFERKKKICCCWASLRSNNKECVCKDIIDIKEDNIQAPPPSLSSLLLSLSRGTTRIQSTPPSSTKGAQCSKDVKNVVCKVRQQGNGITEPFPVKLYRMLTWTEKAGLQHIVSWQPHGRCFVVHSPPKFVTDVMPTYFRQSKISSFQRQLNLYGFKRITQGLDKNGYYHLRFLRGQPELCMSIIRMKINGRGKRTKTRPEDEPNFYNLQDASLLLDIASMGVNAR